MRWATKKYVDGLVGGSGVDSIAKDGDTPLTGDVTLSEGANVTLTQTGQDIEIAATGGGAPTGAAGGVLDGTYPNPGLAAAVAGAGLAETADVLSVNVDGSTLEINADALRVKTDGITANEIAAGAVGASELASTAVTPGTYGDASNVPQVTIDADGRVTLAVDVPVSAGAIDWGETGDLVAEAFGDTADAGALNEAARADHRHAMPTNADVAAAYDAVIDIVSQAEAEAGTSTTPERWTPERVAQAIAALGFAPDVAVQIKTDASGTYTPTTGMVKVLVICVGGGGGAPAATGADEAVSGGGAGGTAIKLFDAATIGASQPYAVGQSSTGAGNTSGLGTANALLQATGGAAGVASGNLTVAAVKGGQGGIGTLGDLNIRGGSGTHATILSTAVSHGGNGGDSIFGGGGRGGSTITTFEDGEAGGAYGAGAGGGKTSNGTDLAAVAGAAGVVYFIEFLKTGGGAGAAAQAGASELIYRYTVTGTDKASIDTGVDTADAGSLDWTNGDILRVFVTVRTDDAAATAAVDITVNNDGSSIYDLLRFRLNNTAVTGTPVLASAAWQPVVHGSGGSTGYPSLLTLTFPAYAKTAFWKVGTFEADVIDQTAGNTNTYKGDVGYRSTSALTRIKIAAQGAAKLKVGTEIAIYKLRSV